MHAGYCRRYAGILSRNTRANSLRAQTISILGPELIDRYPPNVVGNIERQIPTQTSSPRNRDPGEVGMPSAVSVDPSLDRPLPPQPSPSSTPACACSLPLQRDRGHHAGSERDTAGDRGGHRIARAGRIFRAVPVQGSSVANGQGCSEPAASVAHAWPRRHACANAAGHAAAGHAASAAARAPAPRRSWIDRSGAGRPPGSSVAARPPRRR